MKHGKPYFFKSPNRSKKQKKTGSKKGHKSHVRPMPQRIDEYRHVPVSVCPECGNSELNRVQEIRVHLLGF